MMIFEKYGKAHQLRVNHAADLAGLAKLHPALWAVSSAPKDHFYVDPRFLSLLDDEQKGRIRVKDVQLAAEWLLQHLAKTNGIDSESDQIAIEDLNPAGPEYPDLARAIEFVKTCEPNEPSINLELISKVRKSYIEHPPNGDGIILESNAESEELSKWISCIKSVSKGQLDLSGSIGIGSPELQLFIDEMKRWQAWYKKTEQLPETSTLPFGAESEAWIKTLEPVIELIDLFFAQSKIIARDESLLADYLKNEHLKNLKSENSIAIEEQLKKVFPVPPNSKLALDLSEPVENYWHDIFDLISEKISPQLFGESIKELDEIKWGSIKQHIKAYLDLKHSKPSSPLSHLNKNEFDQFFEADISTQISNLISQDQLVSKDLKSLHTLEKCLLLQKYILRFCCNFVNLSELYNPELKALFEKGRLIFDGHVLTFSMWVHKKDEHKNYAKESKIFIVYAEVSDKEKAEQTYLVAAPVTDGSKDSFKIGKRGIFRDEQDREWDAKIVDLLENPISISEAIKAPFIRVLESLQTRFESYLKAPIENFEKSAVQSLPPASNHASDPKKSPSETKNMIVMGSVAIAALGSSFAYVFKTLIAIPISKIVLGVGGLLLLVYLAAFTLAWLSLRKRDLTSFIEASTWAVNLRMPLVRNLRKLFTRRPKLPKGSQTQLIDLLPELLKKSE